MNFGTIKDIFLHKLIESYTTNDTNGKSLYKNFLKLLKESETLKNAFILFSNIENKTIKSEYNAIEYLKDSISLFESCNNKNPLDNEIKKLLHLLESYDIDHREYVTKKIHKDLQELITIEKNIQTLDKLQETKNNIVSWLTTDKNIIKEENNEDLIKPNINPKTFLKIAIDKFNNKYKEELNEEEQNILKILIENDLDKVNSLLVDLIKENINYVNQHLKNTNDLEIKSKLLETKDVIYRMSENKNNINNSVLKLYDLKTSLKNV